jgi:hypothetical protein
MRLARESNAIILSRCHLTLSASKEHFIVKKKTNKRPRLMGNDLLVLKTFDLRNKAESDY